MLAGTVLRLACRRVRPAQGRFSVEPPGDPRPGSRPPGGRGGDEQAGRPRPPGPLPHQGHALRLRLPLLIVKQVTV